MSIKQELRKTKKAQRKAIDNKDVMSLEIQKKLLSLKLYSECKTILCYASYNDEVNTDLIIKNALKDGKALALPKCIDFEGNMNFYIIKSLDDLAIDSYGIREPITEKCDLLTDFENAFIIVPALCFDKTGYRIGYGKGYYDRFLQKHSLISVGLCYNSLIENEIPIGEYDKPVDYIITEKHILNCCNGGKYGKLK